MRGEHCGLPERRMAGFFFVLLLLWSWPLWWAHNRWGVFDWNTCAQRFEALRASLLVFKQWPGLNPWIMGGIPLLGNPNVSLFSLTGIFCLVLGVPWGIHLAIPVYMLVGWLGAWALSGLYFKPVWVRYFFCFYMIANAAVLFHISSGHLVFLNFFYFPAGLYFFLRWRDDPWSGLKAGLVMGAAFLDSATYIIQYALVAFFLILFGQAVAHFSAGKKDIVRWMSLFFSSFGALIFYRLWMILPIAIEFPRISSFQFHLSWEALVRVFFIPLTHFAPFLPREELCFCNSNVELACYLGVFAVPLALTGLRQGWRWWHGAVLVVFWANMGNDAPWHLFHWVQKLPVFASHLCFTRVRMFLPFFMAFPLCEGFLFLWSKTDRGRWRWGRPALVGLMIFAVFEMGSVTHRIMRGSHFPMNMTANNRYGEPFENWRQPPVPADLPSSCEMTWFSTRMNQGYLNGQGDSHLPGKTRVKGRDEKGYVAEYHQGGRPVIPVYWSPNRLLFQNLDPSLPLNLNLNPGRPWTKEGIRLFPHARMVEMDQLFSVMPLPDGSLDLRYSPPGQGVGMAGTGGLVLLSLMVIFWYRNRDREIVSLQTHRIWH